MRCPQQTLAALALLTTLSGCSLIVDSGEYTGGGDAAVDTGPGDTSTDTGGDTNVPDDTSVDAGPCPDPTGCDCDGDGFSAAMPTCPADRPYPGAARDCDDRNPDVYPGALPDCETPEVESCADSWGVAANAMGFREMGLIPAQRFDVESPLTGRNPQIDVVRQSFTGTDGADYDGYLTYITSDYSAAGSSPWVVANYRLDGSIAGSSAIADPTLRGVSAKQSYLARQIPGDGLESMMVLSDAAGVQAQALVRNAIWPLNIVVRGGEPAVVWRSTIVSGEVMVSLSALSESDGVTSSPPATDIAAAPHQLSRAAGPIYMTTSRMADRIHLWDGSDELLTFEDPIDGAAMTGRADIVEVAPADGAEREYLIAMPVGERDSGRVVFANVQCRAAKAIGECSVNGTPGWFAPEGTMIALASSDGFPRPGGVVVASAETEADGGSQNLLVRFVGPAGTPLPVPLVAPLLRSDQTEVALPVVRDLESSIEYDPEAQRYDAVFLAAVGSGETPAGPNALFISGVRMCGAL